MKKSKIKKILMIMMILVILHTISFADVGSFERYDSGSSGSSSSSSSSWDSYDSYYSSGPGGLTLQEAIIAVPIGIGILILLTIICWNVFGKITEGQLDTMYFDSEIDRKKSRMYLKQIKNIDPNFSEEKMLSWVKELFVKLQNAWTQRDWEKMKIYETQSLFEQHKAQVQGYIDTNRINVVEEIKIENIAIYKFSKQGDRDIIEIALQSKMKDYIIDATTKQVLEGDKKQSKGNIYKLTFERKTGIKTSKENTQTINCPNCGAQTDITEVGKCEYCGSILKTGANGWVLSSLEPFRN